MKTLRAVPLLVLITSFAVTPLIAQNGAKGAQAPQGGTAEEGAATVPQTLENLRRLLGK